MKIREEVINKEEPRHYPIAFNMRIAKYKESLKIKPNQYDVIWTIYFTYLVCLLNKGP